MPAPVAGEALHWQATRDARGAEVRDALGHSTHYEYDVLNRTTRTTDAVGGQTTFTYDANGNLVATANQHVQVERAFDAEGRLLQEVQQHTQGQAFTIANSYDANGNRTKRQTTHNANQSAGTGHTTEYAYDLLDQVIGVRIDGGAPMRLQRDALGQLTHEELAPGLNRQLRYNSDGLLTEQSLHAGQQGLFATRYDYDRAGNLTSRHDSAFGKDTYLYDPMGRILKHTDPQGVLHEFFNDPAGDRLITQVSGSGSASTVVGRNDEWQRQGSYQGTHYRFDRAGNLTHKQDSQQLLELAWDANQRLIVNCGGAAAAGGLIPPRLDAGLRATAAHSTLVLDDSNSTAVLIAGKLGPGVNEVEVDRRTIEGERGSGATRLEASHDGYASRFGLIHRRILILRDDGTELRGEDLLVPNGRKGKRGKVAFAIRFHLGPGIEARLSEDGQGAGLALADGSYWQFRAGEGELAIEDSIWVDGQARLMPVQQLVMQGLVSRGGGNFSWLLKKMG